MLLPVRRKSRNTVKLVLSWVRLDGLISDVEGSCGRHPYNEPLPSCLRLEIPPYNLVPIWSLAFFE